jgi:cytochrome c553
MHPSLLQPRPGLDCSGLPHHSFGVAQCTANAPIPHEPYALLHEGPDSPPSVHLQHLPRSRSQHARNPQMPDIYGEGISDHAFEARGMYMYGRAHESSLPCRAVPLAWHELLVLATLAAGPLHGPLLYGWDYMHAPTARRECVRQMCTSHARAHTPLGACRGCHDATVQRIGGVMRVEYCAPPPDAAAWTFTGRNSRRMHIWFQHWARASSCPVCTVPGTLSLAHS